MPDDIRIGADIGPEDATLVYVAPVGTEPGEEGWQLLGTTTDANLTYRTGDPDADDELALRQTWLDHETRRVLAGGTIRFTVPFAPALNRRALRILFGRRWPRRWLRTGPPPLARGCLPASRLARKRGGRRG